MSTPIHLDAVLLDEIVQSGPREHDTAVEGQQNVEEGHVSVAADAASIGPTKAKPFKKYFQACRRYYVEGRIIHKRKLSKKLFFLDLSLVRLKKSRVINCNSNDGSSFQSVLVSVDKTADLDRKQGEEDSAKGGPGNSLSDLAEGLLQSQWEDVKAADETEKAPQKIEIIARFPTLSLPDLDATWHRVQLGSVVKVYGDIELTPRKQDATADDTDQGKERHLGWTPLLHSMDFELLEPWQGKDTFEPNPGAATISNQNHSKQSGPAKSQEGQGKGQKRKSNAMAETVPERGDASQPHCKFWINSGKCNKQQCAFWHETDPVKLKAERRRWVEERIQAKRQLSHHSNDPHQKTTKNQHRERSLYFAHWLINTFTRQFLNSGSGVLDIAGGRGDLSWELQTRQGIRSTTVEPRPGKGMRKWQRRWLEKFKAADSLPGINGGVEEKGQEKGKEGEEEEEEEPNEGHDPLLADLIPTAKTFPLQATEPDRIEAMLDDAFLSSRQALIESSSILIGLHPDQATEPIVRAALKVGKPFAIIPCCVFSRDNLHRRLPLCVPGSEKTESTIQSEGSEETGTRPVSSYDDFVTWLMTLHPEIETTWLNFEGMNRVLYWRGPVVAFQNDKVLSAPPL